MSSEWRMTTDYGQIGTRECFLFKLRPVSTRYIWMPGFAEMFLNVLPSGFSMGAGGEGFGLSITSDFCGSSHRCETFHNDPLNGEQSDFECLNLEIFGFR